MLDTWLERVRTAREARRAYEARWLTWYLDSLEAGCALPSPDE